jgi:two-component system, NtrC family, sensor kinase
MGRLHAFARQRAPERTSTDLNRVVLDALDLRRYALRMQQVDIEADLDYELPLTWADPVQLQQVFLQLVSVAERALLASGGVRRLTVRTRRWGDALEIAFVHSGDGHSTSALARLLEPFGAADDEADDALLSVSSEIVREHGGELRVESAADTGTTLVVALPFVTPPETVAEAIAPLSLGIAGSVS